jgi:hypothetical protein
MQGTSGGCYSTGGGSGSTGRGYVIVTMSNVWVTRPSVPYLCDFCNQWPANQSCQRVCDPPGSLTCSAHLTNTRLQVSRDLLEDTVNVSNE